MFRIPEKLQKDFNFSSDVKTPDGNTVPIDNFDMQEFNMNEAGWTRNDISQLARAQTKAEYDLILSRLSAIKQSKGLPDDMSIEDAMKTIRPRWCQSPNELEMYAEFTNADVMKKLDDAYNAALKDTNVGSGSSSDGAGSPAAE